MNLNRYHVLYVKLVHFLKLDLKLKCESKAIKLLKDTIGENSCEMHFSKTSYNQNHKLKENIDKLYFIRISSVRHFRN